jgi:hypothetical protein
MLRLETETGYWLVRHPDHAQLAGMFAEHWGNEKFLSPEPRARVLKGISRHDDGWIARDAAPQITRQGRPSAYSVELVGKYSAFEEIDLADYLAVRDRAVRLIATEDPYAAVLISLHTYNLLTAHADRSTMAAKDLPLLDEFLVQQKQLQRMLLDQIEADTSIPTDQRSEEAVLEHFKLLQAMDNLSLITCVDFRRPSDLLHALPMKDGGRTEIKVRAVGERHFVLDPYPFAKESLSFQFPARHVKGKEFSSAQEFQTAFAAAPVEILTVTVSAA